MPKNIIALDYGRSRIGVAIASLELLLPLPKETLAVKGLSMDLAIQKTVAFLRDLDPAEIVIGMPLELSGREGPMGIEARRFGDGIARHMADVKISFLDERLSSKAADRLLRERGMRRKQRDQRSDLVAACQILSDFIGFRANGSLPL